MTTAIALIASRCGLSQREAAEFLNVRLDTVKNWCINRRFTPPGAIEQLRGLHARIERAAAEALAQMSDLGGRPDVVELGLATDDAEAQTLGWPCVGAHAAVLGLVAARTALPVVVVPRGRA
jgi:hypothetical protein